VRPAVLKTLSYDDQHKLEQISDKYDTFPEEIKKRCDWKDVSARLLANGGEKFKLTEAMQGGGEFFGIDAKGKVLFRDSAGEPVLFGFDENDKLIQIYDRDPKQKCKIGKWANYAEIREKVLADGYELFADDGNYGFSDEMSQAQARGHGFLVQSKNFKEFRDCLLESGDNPKVARLIRYIPEHKEGAHTIWAHMRWDDISPEYRGSSLNRGQEPYGAVRLLRI
jgi:hypothetical protein